MLEKKFLLILSFHLFHFFLLIINLSIIFNTNYSNNYIDLFYLKK